MSKSTKTTPSHFYASSYRFTDVKLLNLLPSKCISRSRSTTLAMTTFDCKCQNSRKTQFCVSCHRFRYMNLISFYFKKVKITRCNFSHWSHSMTNIKIKKSFTHFCTNYHNSDVLLFQMFDLQNMGHGYAVQFS